MQRFLFLILLAGCSPFSPADLGSADDRPFQPFTPQVTPEVPTEAGLFGVLGGVDEVTITLRGADGGVVDVIETGLTGPAVPEESSLAWHPDGYFLLGHENELHVVGTDGTRRNVLAAADHYRVGVTGGGGAVGTDEQRLELVDIDTGETRAWTAASMSYCFLDAQRVDGGSMLLDVIGDRIVRWSPQAPESFETVLDIADDMNHLGRDGGGTWWVGGFGQAWVQVLGEVPLELSLDAMGTDALGSLGIAPAGPESVWILVEEAYVPKLIEVNRTGEVLRRVTAGNHAVDIVALR